MQRANTWSWSVLGLVMTLAATALSSRAQTAIYTFEPPPFTTGTTTPLLNVPPNSGPAGFQASFTASPLPSTYGVAANSAFLNPLFVGNVLMDQAPPNAPNILNVTLNAPINGVQVDFALFFPNGHLNFQCPAGSTSATTILNTQGGTLTFQSAAGFTSFQLSGFSNANVPILLAIDNLTLTPVPEPGAAQLILAAAGLWTLRIVRSRTRT